MVRQKLRTHVYADEKWPSVERVDDFKRLINVHVKLHPLSVLVNVISSDLILE